LWINTGYGLWAMGDRTLLSYARDCEVIAKSGHTGGSRYPEPLKYWIHPKGYKPDRASLVRNDKIGIATQSPVEASVRQLARCILRMLDVTPYARGKLREGGGSPWWMGYGGWWMVISK